MRRFRDVALAAVLAMLSLCAEARLVSDDSLYGLGTVTRDTETGLGWLDLPLTTAYTLEQTLLETSPGGFFQGFRLATEEELLQLWAHAGINLSGGSGLNEFGFSSENFVPVSSLVTLVGGALSHLGSLPGDNLFDFTQGHVLGTFPGAPEGASVIGGLFVDPDPTKTARVSLSYLPGTDDEVHASSPGTHGSWLVSQVPVAVPEPRSAWLLTFGLLLFLLRGRSSTTAVYGASLDAAAIAHSNDRVGGVQLQNRV